MKYQKLKKFISFLLVLAMCLPMLPQFAIWASAYDVEYNPNSYNNATIAVMYSDGVPVTNAQLEITIKNGNNLLTHEVKNLYAENPTEDTAGQYVFTRYMAYKAHTLTVTVDSVSETFTMPARTTAFTATLSIPSPSEPEEPEVPTEPEEPEVPTDPETPAAEYETFDVYYIANGKIPDTYYGAGLAEDYGPSGNDVPLVQIKVDINKLKTYDGTALTYREGQGNLWEFFPMIGDSGKAEGYSTGAVTAEVLNFWNAVKECMHPDSVTAFKETGLYYEYVGYILKNQSWVQDDLHCDGILYVQPPVYVVELYDNSTYFGGSLTDSDEGHTFLTAQDILDQYETHLQQNITWGTFENGTCTGTYVDPNTKQLCTVTVQQTNYASSIAIENSQIRYQKRTDTYYLAQFNMTVSKGDIAKYTVTYTDGVAGEIVFSDKKSTVDYGVQVPLFGSEPTRPGYIFMGWYLDDDQSAIYRDANISTMTVTADMTFQAVWIPVPKYNGTVHIILDGTWDAENGVLLSGEAFDIPGVTKVAVSTNGTDFIEMTKTGTGNYTAQLENGTYYIYTSTNGGPYEQASQQPLIIENMDRERYLFYNSVTYIPNGGTFEGSTGSYVEYFANGAQADVRTAIPERDGYAFTGWLNSDGVICQPGDVLHEHTNHACVLTAQWVKTADVYINVKLHHSNHDTNQHNYGPGRNNVTFTVDSRPTGTTGDYVELYEKTILWDGVSPFNVEGYSVTTEVGTHEDHDMDLTTYTATAPTFKQVVLEGMDYTLTSAKSGYEIFKITQEEKDGDIYITLELIYMPDDFDFTFYVELDENAKTLPADIKPVAVNVKATAWSDDSGWSVTAQHASTYYRVALDGNGEGSGTVPVSQYLPDSDVPYRYRIQVVSFELPDGTIVPALTQTADQVYMTDCGHYKATIEVEDGSKPTGTNLYGAFYDESTEGQNGTVTAVVSIITHKLTMEANGGRFSDSTSQKTISQLLTVPDISGYTPTRSGYTFVGWYLVDDNNNMTNEQLVIGAEMDKDLVVRAKWVAHVNVEGLVTVAGTYEQVNADGSVTIQTIHQADRVQTVLVLLQKKDPSGYYETIGQQHVTLDYSKTDYYFPKNGQNLPVGVGNYNFTQLPGNEEYRIYILSANYETTYQNEQSNPNSLNAPKAYNTYVANANPAVMGTVATSTATVNAHLHFHPQSFDLLFQVDATEIGSGYRPSSAELLVTYDRHDTSYTDPSQWTVISQMIFGDTLDGHDVAMQNGKGSGSVSVWRSVHDGTTLYDYALRLQSTSMGVYEENPYFTVSYQAPAYYTAEATPENGNQNQMLIAYLTPKSYKINYDTNGGRMTGEYPTTHVWSYETALTNVVPIRSGYEFLGWYTDATLTTKLDANTIGADVAEDVTLYAKWARVVVHVTVNIDTAGVHNKDLTLQLQSRPSDTTGAYTDVAGQTRAYSSTEWQKYNDTTQKFVLSATNAFTGLSSNQDYNATASLEYYYTENSSVQRSSVTMEDGEYIFYTVTIDLKTHGEPLVIFHANNKAYAGNDQFRVYYRATTTVQEGEYTLTADGKVASFYDIPEFSYEVHNDYIFAGWYTAAQGGQPISWDTVYSRTAGTQHVYAHWINVGEVSQHETDTKELTGSTYREYDLAGVQIRKESADDEDHLDSSGNVISGSQQRVYSGLRFVAVLSSRVYNALDALSSSTVEYGFVISRTDTAEYYAEDRGLTQLQYRGSNVNGEDTGSLYNFVQNMRCSGVTDHFSCDDYRLYTGVITYKNQTGQDNPILARAYLRYTDANGLLRTYYNNYTGTNLLGGCSASYTQVYNMLNPDSN